MARSVLQGPVAQLHLPAPWIEVLIPVGNDCHLRWVHQIQLDTPTGAGIFLPRPHTVCIFEMDETVKLGPTIVDGRSQFASFLGFGSVVELPRVRLVLPRLVSRF